MIFLLIVVEVLNIFVLFELFQQVVDGFNATGATGGDGVEIEATAGVCSFRLLSFWRLAFSLVVADPLVDLCAVTVQGRHDFVELWGRKGKAIYEVGKMYEFGFGKIITPNIQLAKQYYSKASKYVKEARVRYNILSKKI